MALSTGSKAVWSDIQDLYTRLQAVYNKWGLAYTAPSNQTNQAFSPNDVNNLKTKIEALKSVSKIGNNANTGITVPTQGTLIQPGPFNSMASTIATVEGICNHCNFDGFGFCSHCSFSESCGCNGSGFSFSFSMCKCF